jgi:putative ABC transport system ATP-binding protein
MDGARPVSYQGTAGAAQRQTSAYGQRPARGPALLEVRGLGKIFTSGGGQVVALREVSLRVYPGELVVIRGRSGAGKTTLLNLIAGLDDPTSGSVTLFGHELGPLSDRQRTELRRKDLGVVFQSAHLFPTLTARENVELPLRLVKAEPAERTRRTDEALALVGLAARAQHRAPELSGGEQQRVALARALVHAPRLVLADEPTGNLDLQTGLAMLELLRSISHQAGISFLITTHDPAAVQMADELYDISDGVLTPAAR